MAELPNRKLQGNNIENAVSEPQPKQERDVDVIQWVTESEATELDKMLFKSFVKKGEKGKEFFYRIIGSHPFVPANIMTKSNQSLVKFEVRKYHRNEFVTSKRREGGIEHEEQSNKPVDWVTIDDMGNGKMLDEDASFFMEAREFQGKFERDTE